MRNPFKTEEAAFRFLMLTIGYFGLIGIASVINKWAGLAVFLLLTGGVVAWWLSTRSARETPVKQPPAVHPPGMWRLLVVANETVGGEELLDQLKRDAPGRRTDVLVVVPALNSPLKHWVSDEDGARTAASERLEASLAAMRAAGITARGEIGDGDPLQAIGDALRTFAPDELVISTHPEGRSHWLERGVVASAEERFDIPVTHVVVDLEAQHQPESAAKAADS
ncbi:MAG TPA: universal stress protein [Gaiellaceae bacterium]|jgi:GABA permease|nr:universal stress protein [Gaiellaceae bacterium]